MKRLEARIDPVLNALVEFDWAEFGVGDGPTGELADASPASRREEAVDYAIHMRRMSADIHAPHLAGQGIDSRRDGLLLGPLDVEIEKVDHRRVCENGFEGKAPDRDDAVSVPSILPVERGRQGLAVPTRGIVADE
jgi:hypothetical protein